LAPVDRLFHFQGTGTVRQGHTNRPPTDESAGLARGASEQPATSSSPRPAARYRRWQFRCCLEGRLPVRLPRPGQGPRPRRRPAPGRTARRRPDRRAAPRRPVLPADRRRAGHRRAAPAPGRHLVRHGGAHHRHPRGGGV